MMSKWIGNASHAPAMHVLYRNDLCCAGAYCAFEDSVRIGNRQDHPNSTTAKRLRTEVVMLRRFVAQPKLRAVDRKPRDHGPITPLCVSVRVGGRFGGGLGPALLQDVGDLALRGREQADELGQRSLERGEQLAAQRVSRG